MGARRRLRDDEGLGTWGRGGGSPPRGRREREGRHARGEPSLAKDRRRSGGREETARGLLLRAGPLGLSFFFSISHFISCLDLGKECLRFGVCGGLVFLFFY